MPRRPTIDILGRWFWLVLLPALLLAPFRAVRWLWRLANRHNATSQPAGDFYRSAAWRRARILCFERSKRLHGQLVCGICGWTEAHGKRAFHCGHIKSRSKWPELALDQNNLTPLCEDCNVAASNDYEDLDLNRCRRKYA